MPVHVHVPALSVPAVDLAPRVPSVLVLRGQSLLQKQANNNLQGRMMFEHGQGGKTKQPDESHAGPTPGSPTPGSPTPGSPIQRAFVSPWSGMKCHYGPGKTEQPDESHAGPAQEDGVASQSHVQSSSAHSVAGTLQAHSQEHVHGLVDVETDCRLAHLGHQDPGEWSDALANEAPYTYPFNTLMSTAPYNILTAPRSRGKKRMYVRTPLVARRNSSAESVFSTKESINEPASHLHGEQTPRQQTTCSSAMDEYRDIVQQSAIKIREEHGSHVASYVIALLHENVPGPTWRHLRPRAEFWLAMAVSIFFWGMLWGSALSRVRPMACCIMCGVGVVFNPGQFHEWLTHKQTVLRAAVTYGVTLAGVEGAKDMPATAWLLCRQSPTPALTQVACLVSLLTAVLASAVYTPGNTMFLVPVVVCACMYAVCPRQLHIVARVVVRLVDEVAWTCPELFLLPSLCFVKTSKGAHPLYFARMYYRSWWCQRMLPLAFMFSRVDLCKGNQDGCV